MAATPHYSFLSSPVAVDMSSAQNSLLELKIAGISHLEYEEYLVLLGETTSDDVSRYNSVCWYQLSISTVVASCLGKQYMTK